MTHSLAGAIRPILIWLTLATLAISGLRAQDPPVSDPLQYADLADFAADAPIIARVRVKEAIQVEPERAIGAPPGTARLYVISDTQNLIRGERGLPASIRYIIDLPVDSRGRPPRIKKQEFFIFARPLGNGNVQLIAPDSQIRWTAQRDAIIRSIVSEAVAANAPPAILGVSSAFHAAGTIIGEGETQIFLETASGNPVSISVLSRENQAPVWAVSLSEIVDESAQRPRRPSLLWYRLACFLPNRLGPGILPDGDPAEAARAREDYALVLRELGTCPRHRPADGLPIRLY